MDACRNALPSLLYSLQAFLPRLCKLVPKPTFIASMQMLVFLTGIVDQYVNMPFGAQQVLRALPHRGERCQIQLHHNQLTSSLHIFCIASDVGSSFFGLLQVSTCDDNSCTCCTEVSCRISASSLLQTHPHMRSIWVPEDPERLKSKGISNWECGNYIKHLVYSTLYIEGAW